MRRWFFLAAVMGGLAVAMGAFAAHGLARTLDARMLAVFETGARYQMFHALAMGLAAGANDYITKPFHPIELESRVRVGQRMIRLQTSLAARVRELEEASSHVKRLQGLLPICSYCKKVRNETNYWQQVDSYLTSHSDVELSHGVCPDCFERVMSEMDKVRR